MGQQFSPGLLYYIAPDNFSELHLQDEEMVDQFEWEQSESAMDRLAQVISSIFTEHITK